MKRKFLKNCKTMFRKAYALLMVLGIMVTLLGLPPFINVFANEGENNTKLVFSPSSNAVQIDGTDLNKVIIMKNGNSAGFFKVKIGDDYQTPSMNGANVEFALSKWEEENYQVSIELTVEEGYQRSGQYTYKGTQGYFPGEGNLGLDISENGIHNLNFTIDVEETSIDNQGDNNPGDTAYKIFAKFAGVNNPVDADENGDIFLPNGWTSGNVEFYAKVCNNNGNITANSNGCSVGTVEDLRVDIIMPANRDQINNTVDCRGSGNSSILYVNENFSDYGKAVLHLQKDGNNPDDMMDNTNLAIVSLVSEDLIFLKADSPINMSYSVGTGDYDSAMLTNRDSGKIAIFFGNTQTKLIASGSKVLKIKNVAGATRTLNDDGSSTITLPDLSVETTTKLTLTIELNDHSTVTKTLDIARTAIALNFNKAGGDATLEAGYVMNKGYLYENQNHNDEIFDAYLQVILYKDNIVAGYKQIKIDDEDFVNGLEENQSGAMEILDPDNKIILYGKALNNTIEGVNRASVFLTNGPIDGDSDILPSIEFGIGAGVEISWEVE